MAKKLFTEADVRAMRAGDELVLEDGAIATPSALDAAFARGINVRRSSRGEGGGFAHGKGPCCKTFRAMIAREGTYVVEVRGGVAQVHRLAGGSPEKVGEMPLQPKGASS